MKVPYWLNEDGDCAHEPANWQASHLSCNVQAGAKGRRAVA
jgi:hypothetical protein